MAEQTYVIREDEHCLWCGSQDLTYVGQDVDGWWVGMECAELHCNACGDNFAVDCDETDDYRQFRAAHPNGLYSQARQAAGQKEEQMLNIYKVTDCEGTYVFVAAENRRDALNGYPTEYAEHAYLMERDTDFQPGECTLAYERSRGVDLILSGRILPNWCNDLHDADFDDYRDWDGYRKAPAFSLFAQEPT